MSAVAMQVPISSAVSNSVVMSSIAAVSSRTSNLTVEYQTNVLEASVSECVRSSTDFKFRLLHSDVWTRLQEGRFNVLSRKEVSGLISVQELTELEALTRRRREQKYPRSADEILWQRRQDALTKNLVEALQAYVKFHEAPRRP